MDIALKTARVALVGNPNSGKTALFNALTGAHQKVANYAGVTVERKEGLIRAASGRTMSVLDLPGTYSLRARSPDEEVTRDAVLGRLAGETPPDVVVCVADATNLRLVLRLILELKAVGRPMVLALNMYDIAQRQGLRIDLERLGAELGVPIITTVATRKRGIDDLIAAIEDRAAVAAVSESQWHSPDAAQLRTAAREAERIMKACVRPPERPDTLTGKIDSILLHPVAGLVILFTLLFVMFQAVFSWAAPLMDGIEAGIGWLGGLVANVLPDGLLQSLIVDGIISGVGSVLVFLPQILILFLFIIALEDFGYMARAAFLMDKIMGGAGLHGRAFIPNETVWGFANLQGLVMFGLYAAGIVSALLVSLVIRKVFWRGAVEPFMMELPTYKTPDLKSVGFNLWLRAKIFLNRAGRIILPAVIILWVLATFPYPPENATLPAIDYSFAGMLGRALEPIFAPIGFNWQMVIALIPGMAAREVAVAALATTYAIADTENATGLLASTLSAQWSLATALSFLAWYIFAPQCVATLGVVKRETNSWRWTWIMIGYMFGLAYLASLVTYHVAVALGGG